MKTRTAALESAVPVSFGGETILPQVISNGNVLRPAVTWLIQEIAALSGW
jgi:hypothetical protein